MLLDMVVLALSAREGKGREGMLCFCVGVRGPGTGREGKGREGKGRVVTQEGLCEKVGGGVRPEEQVDESRRKQRLGVQATDTHRTELDPG